MPRDSPPKNSVAVDALRRAPPPIRNPYKVRRQSDYAKVGSHTSGAPFMSSPFPLPPQSQRKSSQSPKSVLLDGHIESLSRTTLLFAVLLRQSIQDLLATVDDFQNTQDMLVNMCECLGIPPPFEPLRAKYDTPRAHMESRAALVLEEARFTLCQTLHELLVQKNTEPAFCIDIKHIHRDGQSKSPVALDASTTFRRKTYKRGWFTPTQMSFLIQGQVLHCSNGEMQRLGLVSASNTHAAMAKHGLLEIQFFDHAFAPSSSIVWTIRPVGVSLISIARQFAAVMDYERVVPFFDVIRGARLPADPAGVRLPYTPPRWPDRACVKPEQLEVPVLNESQQRAATLFLESPEGSITVVQGPPGTGKSNLVVGVISKYLLTGVVGCRPHRVMICAPTNKAVSHIAKRFLDSVRPDQAPSLRIIALGNEEKLDYVSDQRPFPVNMKAIYLFSWVKCTVDEYAMLKFGERGHYGVSELIEKRGHLELLQNRLQAFLGELPLDLVQALKAIDDVSLSANSSLDTLSFDRKIDDLIHIVLSLDQSFVRTTLLNNANVIFSTLSAARSAAAMSTSEIDCLIVDEAAAATEPALYVPFHLQPKKMLLVGDPMQLPAVVKSPLASSLGLAESFHERVTERLFCREVVLLDTQYRMKPDISLFPSLTFYNGMLRNGPNVINLYYGTATSYLLDGRSFIFLQVLGDATASPITKSFSNYGEAEAILRLLCDLRTRADDRPWESEDRLRIITFYHEQVSLIRKVLRQHGGIEKVSVETVDSTQGCESDVVILSFVKGSTSAGFLKDDRRLNVALTRARHQLICVGDVDSMQYLHEPGASTLRSLSADAYERNAVV